jgi:hypothetical protein
MMRRCCLILLLAAQSLLAQDTLRVVPASPRSTGWPTRKVAATGVVGGMLVGSLISSYYDWWKDSAEPFHFSDDGLFNNYSLGIDKIGHAYTSYFYFHTFRNVMLWGGYDSSDAFWLAAGSSALFALSIEIGDGLSPYGFSAYDLAFNLGGLGYAMAQEAVPFLRNFSLKWSYVPEEGYRWPPHFTDHYDAHTYWLVVNVHNLLPGNWRACWPEFIQLAFGYGVDDRQSRRESVIGLDFNIGVFRAENPELRLLQQTVNLFPLPAPAVKFTEGKRPRWYALQWN